MATIEWMLLVVLVYGGLMFLLFAVLRVASAADDAADRALMVLLRQRRAGRAQSKPRHVAVA